MASIALKHGRFLFSMAIAASVISHGAEQQRGRTIPTLKADWIGQDGSDKVGPNARLEPSDVQDIHCVLDGLEPSLEIKALEITGLGGDLWRFGEPFGPFLCSIERSKRAKKADLFIEPSRVEQGRPFEIKLTYVDGSIAQLVMKGGVADPRKRMPNASLSGQWLGVSTSDVVGSGRAPGPDGQPDAIIELTGLSQRTHVKSVILSDPNGTAWSFGPQNNRKTNRLEFFADSQPGKGRIHFQPEVSSKNTFEIKIVYATDYEDGTRIRSGKYEAPTPVRTILPNPDPVTEPSAKPPEPPPVMGSAYLAKPGENLAELVKTKARIRLKSGIHQLDQPLVLTRPILIEAEPQTQLYFRQAANAPPWTEAIGISSSQVKLEGFTIRVDDSVLWNNSVSYGAAVIGGPLEGESRPESLELIGLDIQSPRPAADGWPEAIRLARLVRISGGTIHDCVLQGGIVECAQGPWTITKNRHLGSVEHSQTAAGFSIHASDNLIIRGNIIEPKGSGKLWRFLVLTGRGDTIEIADNQVRGVGPSKNDPFPHPNAPEVILTESYRVLYEGTIAGLSKDGRALAIHKPQSPGIVLGSVVAVLDGPEAGKWRRIVRVDGPQVFTLDQPISPATKSVSVTTGFTQMKLVKNTIDCRNNDLATPLVLTGNHFGTMIEENVLIGGSEPFRIAATATEEPVHWGYTHSPLFGVRLIGNVFRDNPRAGSIAVDHSNAIEPGAGRVYLTLQAKRNSFLRQTPAPQPREVLRIGVEGSIDPGELLYFDEQNSATSMNRIDVHSSTVNGSVITKGTFSW